MNRMAIERFVPDVRLVQDVRFPQHSSVHIDWFLQSDGTLDDTQALATAIIVALGTNALASTEDILPDPDSTDRQGWWGDLDAEEIWNGWPIGSKLWLLRRAKITEAASFEGSTVARVKQYIRQAIQPFIDRRICSRMDVEATRNLTNRNEIDALVWIYRGPTIAIELRFAVLWDEITGVSQATMTPVQ